MIKTTRIKEIKDNNFMYFYNNNRIISHYLTKNVKDELCNVIKTENLFTHEVEKETMPDVGLDFVVFPKYKAIQASELRIGDAIRIDRVVYDIIISMKSVQIYDNTHFFIEFEHTTLAICPKHDDMLAVEMFRFTDIPKPHNQILVHDELREIEFVEYGEDFNTIKFYGHELSLKASATDSVLIASRHLTESDAIIIE